MKKNKIYYYSLLILGLLFSSIVGFNYNLNQGFEFAGFWINFPPNLFDMAWQASDEIYLKSHLIGYLFYSTFAILIFIQNPSIRKSLALISFAILSDLVVVSEFYSIYQDINQQFVGRHFRIGILVFLLGLIVLRKHTKKHIKNTSVHQVPS